MRKTSFIAFFSVIALFSLLSACKKKQVAPVKDRMAKVWSAQKVEYNNATVYTKGATGNAFPGYDKFRLDLSAPPVARYTELDGNVFVGEYSVPTDDRLVLTKLNPSPSGDNGTIEFTISNLSDNSVTLTRTTGSQKSGGTINRYTLTNP